MKVILAVFFCALIATGFAAETCMETSKLDSGFVSDVKALCGSIPDKTCGTTTCTTSNDCRAFRNFDMIISSSCVSSACSYKVLNTTERTNMWSNVETICTSWKKYTAAQKTADCDGSATTSLSSNMGFQCTVKPSQCESNMNTICDYTADSVKDVMCSNLKKSFKDASGGSCGTDAECALKPCYDDCLTCNKAADCDAQVKSGNYAAKDADCRGAASFTGSASALALSMLAVILAAFLVL
eukprot:GCRY01000103.1.p1 GENE.GCRY01000103.1~~GCRY01000103.1.p1  ORF type:complete len:241 (-),score=33.96 GCRY01000103.1:96-818(-)